jgi:hypothetical protein
VNGRRRVRDRKDVTVAGPGKEPLGGRWRQNHIYRTEVVGALGGMQYITVPRACFKITGGLLRPFCERNKIVVGIMSWDDARPYGCVGAGKEGGTRARTRRPSSL